MNRFLLSVMSFFVIVFLVSCQSTYDSSIKFTPEQLREDLQVFRQSLEKGQPGLYRYASKNEFDNLLAKADQSLERPLDVNEFYRVLTPLIAAVKCGHTNISLPDFIKEQNGTTALAFPALIKIINGKMFVRRDLTDRNNALAGKEILSINETPTSQIISTMLAATASDGNIQTSKIKRIEEWNFIEKLTPLTALQSPFMLSILDSETGRTEQVQINGINVPALYQNWETWFPQDKKPFRSGEIKFAENGNVAVMTVREFGGFADENRKQGLADFYQSSFQQIATNKTKVLILDLRDNGGGDDQLGALLLSYLINEPFEYFKDIVANGSFLVFGKGITRTTFTWLSYKIERREDSLYHVVNYPNLGIIQPNSPAFSGKLYVLMNGGSFSTTAEVITQLHNRNRAEFIGDEAGGANSGNNSGTMAQVALPNTKLTLLVPLMSFYLPIDEKTNGSRGVKPDYPIDYSITEYLTNSDKEMSFALEKAKQLEH